MRKSSLLLFALLLAGCSHTNELMKYDLNGQNAYFEEYVSSEARTIQIEMKEPTKTDKDKKEDDAVSILEAVVSAGTAALTAEKISDIKDMVDTYELTTYVADGLKNTLDTYVNLKPVDDKKAAQFIVETELERCVLYVTKDNVQVTVQANVKIIDVASGNIVWENWESDTVPVGNSNNKVKVKKGAESKVLTALQLASLSKKEVNACVGEAAEDVGREMGETFREDLAESRNK